VEITRIQWKITERAFHLSYDTVVITKTNETRNMEEILPSMEIDNTEFLLELNPKLFNIWGSGRSISFMPTKSRL
jgi:hypothetical protein